MVALIVMVLLVFGCWGAGHMVKGMTRRPGPPGAEVSNSPVFPPPPPPPQAERLARVITGLLGLGIAAALGWVIYYLYALSAIPTQLGRPLRIRNRTWLGPRRRGVGCDDGARPALDGLGAWQRAWRGERWLAAARTEHASIPAFDRLAAQLAQIHAPAALIDRCHAARADEARHARRCFTLARAYSGVPWTGAALPALDPGNVHLPDLAIESLHDGCVGEGIAADLAAAAAARSTDPVLASSLAMIADDEARHAELAWSVVELCLARGGAAVHCALAGESLDPRPPAAGPLDLSRRERQRIAAVRCALVRARLATLLATHAAASADAPGERHADPERHRPIPSDADRPRAA